MYLHLQFIFFDDEKLETKNETFKERLSDFLIKWNVSPDIQVYLCFMKCSSIRSIFTRNNFILIGFLFFLYLRQFNFSTFSGRQPHFFFFSEKKMNKEVKTFSSRFRFSPHQTQFYSSLKRENINEIIYCYLYRINWNLKEGIMELFSLLTANLINWNKNKHFS